MLLGNKKWGIITEKRPGDIVRLMQYEFKSRSGQRQKQRLLEIDLLNNFTIGHIITF